MPSGYIKITRPIKVGARQFDTGIHEVSGEVARQIISRGAGVPTGVRGSVLTTTRQATEMKIGRAR